MYDFYWTLVKASDVKQTFLLLWSNYSTDIPTNQSLPPNFTLKSNPSPQPSLGAQMIQTTQHTWTARFVCTSSWPFILLPSHKDVVFKLITSSESPSTLNREGQISPRKFWLRYSRMGPHVLLNILSKPCVQYTSFSCPTSDRFLWIHNSSVSSQMIGRPVRLPLTNGRLPSP